MLIFLAIMLGGIVILIGGSIFGHDHDSDVDHDVDGDADHDHGEATVSLFSPKVIGTFIMGFGASGGIAKFYHMDNVGASLIGVGSGIVLGLLMYFAMRLMYSQQGWTTVKNSQAVGQTGMVIVSIDPGEVGQVKVNLGEQSETFFARSADPSRPIPRGASVRVKDEKGGELLVETV